MEYTLYNYQKEAVDNFIELFKKKNNILHVLPTGSGKSVIISSVCKYLKTQHTKAIVLVHSINVLKQNCEAFGLKDIKETDRFITKDSDIHFSTIQTFANRTTDTNYDVVIIDEVHRADFSNTTTQYYKVIKKLKPSVVYGLTATPFRDNELIIKKNKGREVNNDNYFDEIDFRIFNKTLLEDKKIIPLFLQDSDINYILTKKVVDFKVQNELIDEIFLKWGNINQIINIAINITTGNFI